MTDFTEKDFVEGAKKTFMSMFHDLATNLHGINITTPTIVFGFLLERNDFMTQAGGELTMEKARALRDFLNDLLSEQECVTQAHYGCKL